MSALDSLYHELYSKNSFKTVWSQKNTELKHEYRLTSYENVLVGLKVMQRRHQRFSFLTHNKIRNNFFLGDARQQIKSEMSKHKWVM